MKKKIKKLTTSEIQILKDRFNSHKFHNDCDLVYEDQIPNTGIVLVEGQIALLKKKKIDTTIEPGTLLGVNNIIRNEPSTLRCKVVGNSELIILNKSEILAALNDKDPELYAIIKESVS
jgi:hypothetical protein